MHTFSVPWYVGPAPQAEWPEVAPEDWPEGEEYPPPPGDPVLLSQPGALAEDGVTVVWCSLPAGLKTQSYDLDRLTGVVTWTPSGNASVPIFPGWEEV